MATIDCSRCRQQSSCCDLGAWVDLEEAKKILPLGLKGGFHHFEEDESFPSGYKLGTSYDDQRCSFLTSKGLCAIHKVDYNLKPSYCKEFPYEDGKLSPFVNRLCAMAKSKKKKKPAGSKLRGTQGQKTSRAKPRS